MKTSIFSLLWDHYVDSIYDLEEHQETPPTPVQVFLSFLPRASAAAGAGAAAPAGSGPAVDPRTGHLQK